MENREIIVLIGLLVIVVCLIISNIIQNKKITQNKKIHNKCTENFDNYEITNDKTIPVAKIDKNVCSKQCCKFEVWQPPFVIKNPNVDPKFMDKFIGTNLSCGNGPESGGCVCMTKNDFNYIANHGQSYNKKYNDDIIT